MGLSARLAITHARAHARLTTAAPYRLSLSLSLSLSLLFLLFLFFPSSPRFGAIFFARAVEKIRFYPPKIWGQKFLDGKV